MTNDLELAKRKLQLKKLELAKDEFKVKIMEKHSQIEHFESEIKIQEKAIIKLKEELGE